MISNEQKSAIWDAYRARRPTRVPLNWTLNPRVVLFDPKWNPRGITFQEYFNNAAATVEVQLKWMDYQFLYLNQYSDNLTGRPKEFSFHVDCQNFFDAVYFGCPLEYRDGQVGDVFPILQGRDKDRIFEMDIDHPLDNPAMRHMLSRQEALEAAAAGARVPGVTFTVAPMVAHWCGGALTVACQLRGEEIYTDLIDDPPYAMRLMDFIMRGTEIRNRALFTRAGLKPFGDPTICIGDDCIQLISTEMYSRMVLPFHRRWYGLAGADVPRFMHLCGDATRHFPTIRRELNVCSFDTGFPVDHGWLREALGPDVEIMGGTEVSLLLNGTPRQVYERTRQILNSGVKAGGRFILREANNLPPRVPEANLAAMYRCCLDHGNYPQG